MRASGVVKRQFTTWRLALRAVTFPHSEPIIRVAERRDPSDHEKTAGL